MLPCCAGITFESRAFAKPITYKVTGSRYGTLDDVISEDARFEFFRL